MVKNRKIYKGVFIYLIKMTSQSITLDDSELEKAIESLLESGISKKNIKDSLRGLNTANPNDVQRYTHLLQQEIDNTKNPEESVFLNRINRMSSYISTKESQIDYLTQLPNRSFLEAEIKRQLSATHRNRMPFSILNYDLDDFKRVNDTFGHPEGDNVLRGVAEIAINTFRESDLSARVGGDEFYTVAGTGRVEAYKAAERFREQIEKSGLGVTASIGLISVTEADAVMLLYGEKGRNLICDYFKAKKSGKPVDGIIDTYLENIKSPRDKRKRRILRDETHQRLKEIELAYECEENSRSHLSELFDRESLSKKYSDVAVRSLMKRADNALYTAKESGKNMVYAPQ